MSEDREVTARLEGALNDYLRLRTPKPSETSRGNERALSSLVEELRRHLAHESTAVPAVGEAQTNGLQSGFSNYGQNFGNYAQNFGNYAQNFGNYAQSLDNLSQTRRPGNTTQSAEERRRLQKNSGVPSRLPNGRPIPTRQK
jgi:hypothetical protein